MPLNFCKTKLVLFNPKRYAGHSKWANIKHTKGLKDSQKSLLYTRLCQRMKVAIQENGNDNPSTNLQLSQAIQIAKKENMPLTSIQNCIKSVQNDKSQAKSVWYEIKGPRGCFLIALTFTDNTKRTKDTLGTILKKYQVSFTERSCRHIFEKKGEIIATPPTNLSNMEEATIDHAIECGAEEVVPADQEGAYKFICQLESLNTVTTKLEQLHYSIEASDFNFIPTIKVQLADSELELMSKLIEKLEEHPNVVDIYDNIA